LESTEERNSIKRRHKPGRNGEKSKRTGKHLVRNEQGGECHENKAQIQKRKELGKRTGK